MEVITLRTARPEEFDQAMELVEQGRAFLKQQGIDQWQAGYPDEACVRDDLKRQKGYFLEDESGPVGYLCLNFDGEPDYDRLNGKWLGSGSYCVIHRMTISRRARGKGLAAKGFALVEQLCREKGAASIRVDTNADNQIMRHLFEKMNFQYCGTVFIETSDKVAFEKRL